MEDISFDGGKGMGHNNNHLANHSVSSGNVAPSGPGVENGPHPSMGIDIAANNALSSVNIMRRSSLLNDSSAPINIPGE